MRFAKSLVANLNKPIIDNNKYFNGSTIPNWSKYKFHSVSVVLTSTDNSITDIQITLFGNQLLTYNNNKHNTNQSIKVVIQTTGNIIISGYAPLVSKSHIKNIFMWN